jgi:hypothetical protein
VTSLVNNNYQSAGGYADSLNLKNPIKYTIVPEIAEQMEDSSQFKNNRLTLNKFPLVGSSKKRENLRIIKKNFHQDQLFSQESGLLS